MNEVSQRALDWFNGLDPEVRTVMQQPSYEDSLRQARSAEEDARIRALATTYGECETNKRKISILAGVIALD